jgi:hypothetical protein
MVVASVAYFVWGVNSHVKRRVAIRLTQFHGQFPEISPEATEHVSLIHYQ